MKVFNCGHTHKGAAWSRDRPSQRFYPPYLYDTIALSYGARKNREMCDWRALEGEAKAKYSEWMVNITLFRAVEVPTAFGF